MEIVLLPHGCPCGGPIAIPRDAYSPRPGVVMTNYPSKVRRVHTDDCLWSDRELPLD